MEREEKGKNQVKVKDNGIFICGTAAYRRPVAGCPLSCDSDSSHGGDRGAICEARNKNHLMKAKEAAEAMGLVEGEHFGLIYDNCYTELQPEEADGTTLTGIWFCPLPDDVSKSISKKYHLYM